MLKNIKELFYHQDFKNANIPIEDIKQYNIGRSRIAKKNICNAPNNSLYFGLGGKVNVCCYSKYFAIENIKNKTINEIWFGKKMDAFREEVGDYKLNTQCLECKVKFKEKNYDTIYAKKYDQYVRKNKKYPSLIEFELDNTCNLECEMCNGVFSSAIRKNREKLPPLISPYGKDFLKQLEEYLPHVEQANFLGGEPFLINIYLDIWEKIIEINPKITIYVQTNCTVLNNRVKNILKRLNFSFGISIDSFEKETYEFIRKNANFEKVMSNFEWFKNYSKQNNAFLGVSICAMPQNWKEIPKMIEKCNNENISIYFNTVRNPENMSFYNLNYKETSEILKEYQETKIANKTKIEKNNFKAFQSLINILSTQKHIKYKNNNANISYSDFTKIIKKTVIDSNNYKKESVELLKNNFNIFEQEFIEDELNFFCSKITKFDLKMNMDKIAFNILNTKIDVLIAEMKIKLSNAK